MGAEGIVTKGVNWRMAWNQLRDTCTVDGIPLQEKSTTDTILQALTKAAEATQSEFLQLEEEHTVQLPSTTEGVGEAA